MNNAAKGDYRLHISTEDIKADYERQPIGGPYREANWFSPKTLRFFSSRIAGSGYLTADKGQAYFVSSERDSYERQCRRYSVRRYTFATKAIDTVGGFQAFKTSAQAHRAAKDYAKNGEDETSPCLVCGEPKPGCLG